MTETPAAFTYTVAVSTELVRIALIISALNGLDIFSCDL